MKTPEEINDLILKDYLEWIEKDNIICPLPGLWIEIFSTIQYRIKCSYDELAELIGRPLILNAWMLPNKTKKKRFIEHLKFAHRKSLMHYINFRIDMYQSDKRNKERGNFLQIFNYNKMENHISKEIVKYY